MLIGLMHFLEIVGISFFMTTEIIVLIWNVLKSQLHNNEAGLKPRVKRSGFRSW